MTRLLRGLDTSRLRLERYETIARLVALKPSDRVIDIGCGPGTRSIAAFNKTNEIVGVDLFEEAKVEIEQPNFRYVSGDACDLDDIADKAFDVAISVGMLEHIRPRQRLVAAIRETQRIAGRYCFVVPHRYALSSLTFSCRSFRSGPLAQDRAHQALPPRDTGAAALWAMERINWLRADKGEVFADPNLVIKNTVRAAAAVLLDPRRRSAAAK